jgi:hypothetical protein
MACAQGGHGDATLRVTGLTPGAEFA